jgi:hypothetical protein
MPTGNVAKVLAQKDGLKAIYRKAFNALKNADRSKFNDIQRENVGMLESSLDPPEKVAFDKAVAVISSVLAHGKASKIKLEYFFKVPIEGGQTVGEMIRNELEKLDVSLSDLQVFAKENGWVDEG